MSSAEVLNQLGPATRAWFTQAFDAPTRVQTEGWPCIQRGEHTLLLAPTGSGKTLASFLACLDRLAHDERERTQKGWRVLYVSPLKALVYDIERNLRAPLVGIHHAGAREGVGTRSISVDVRTGDTPQDERARMKRNPGDILVTTPESLYLLLTSEARENLRTVETVIIDEIHTMAGAKRGIHLALSLERLSTLCDTEPQRIGLSATQRPLERIARYLGGDREVRIVDTSEPPRLDLEICVPVADMENPGPAALAKERTSGPLLGPAGLPKDSRVTQYVSPQQGAESGIWPSIYPKVLELIREHRSTIVFTNSRLLCERLAKKLNELAGEHLVYTHHGSLSHVRRAEIEELLKTGQVPALVATSSLELGIDMGAVDLVICVESPGSVARGLQRVGRAGHQVGETSVGRIFPKYKGDLVECAVVASRMARGAIEETHLPRNCLDVLAQHVVSMVAMDSWQVPELLAFLKRTEPYKSLTANLLESVLDMLSGRYPSDAFADLSPRINYDRNTETLTPRKSARLLSVLNAGTIEDRGLYRVHLGEGGPRLGELDEEMVYETRQGDTIILGASTWRVTNITRDQVHVEPAPGEPGRLPFWKGERPGRPLELGKEMGKFLRDLGAAKPKERVRFVKAFAPLDDLAARNLVDYVEQQREATGTLPTDRAITVERFRDELGDWRICILTPFGARVHAPWAVALEAMLADDAGFEVQVLYSDDGLALRLVDSEETPDTARLFPDPEDIEERITQALGDTALFASRFRMNASRALLLPRKKPDGRQPLWLQRRRAQGLQAVAMQYPAFPIVLETYRECLQEQFDVPALREVLGDIRSRRIAVEDVETRDASPFARSLAFQYIASYLYDGDQPLAERKAAALTLDKALLRELLGDAELRELLESDAVDSVHAQLQFLEEDRRARHPDAVHDLLRRLGDLSEVEVIERSQPEGDPQAWLEELCQARRALLVRVGDEPRFIAVEDAGRYRDALGVALPTGVPKAFLGKTEEPLLGLLLRYAKTRAPFSAAEVAARFGLLEANVVTLLGVLVERGLLEHGEITPGKDGEEYVHVDVLRRLKRASLAKLRREVEPVDAEVLARFLAGWQEVRGEGRAPRKRSKLVDVVEQLEGCPLPWSDLVDEALPGRIDNFTSDDLDTLGATGQLVWVGRGPLGQKDGRVALFRRDRVHLLLDPASDEEIEGDLAQRVYAHLQARGASFFFELQQVCEGSTVEEITRALWDLVWAGLVTNDTFQALKGLRARGGRRKEKLLRSVGGRWSTVRDLLRGAPEVTDTEKLHARALTLLVRYGVVSREAAHAEKIPGGFSTLYPVLRALEEEGKVRRGHFASGLTGAQFALAGAIDRLRAHRVDDDQGVVRTLAATDPANPWGALLPWPVREESRTPKRAAGARVVTVDGRPALYLEKGGRSVVTFDGERADLDRALARLRERQDVKRMVVKKIDGRPSLESSAVEAFLAAGFERDYAGLVLG
jgi:ATP-dependent Lhr-like helicase